VVITAAVALTAGFGWLWWQGVPALYRIAGTAEDPRYTAITGTRAALLAGFLCLVALCVFVIDHRIHRGTRTLKLTKRQATERYTAAIELLGDDDLDARLCAILTLEQIALDSHRHRDRATILEALSAFVRVHSDPVYQRKASLGTHAEPVGREEAIAYANDRRPPVDVQAAVTVLGCFPDSPWLRADLTGAYLKDMSLRVAALREANLTGANLTGADLAAANLTRATLREADLTEANLPAAHLTGADLRGADLSEAILTRAVLAGGLLDRANLHGANLRLANLQHAKLPDAVLSAADLRTADLAGADLTGANLRGADLRGANLLGASLRGADLRQANLTQEQLDTAADISEAQPPEELQRP
jgi:uncharacterized protein YjbI with pentapeptide repeats